MTYPALFDTAWRLPPPRIALPLDRVHVWRAQLDMAEDLLAWLYAALVPDEVARAGRIRPPLDRKRFIAARGTLRFILGRYLNIAPGQVQIDYGPQGKPRLVQEPLPPIRAIIFNISHSHGWALFAFTRGRNVGIDIELVRPDLATQAIAEHLFSAAEVAALRALPARDQTLAFFHGWTRKEAFSKARGEGLTTPLNRFDVSVAPGEPPMLLGVAGSPGEAARWTLCDLTAAPGYVAALAVEGTGWQLNAWDWQAPISPQTADR